MRINPLREVRYRVRLSSGYLERARRFLSTGDYKESVEASQLSAENAAKAVIALYRIPSWSHDPSDELLEVAQELPKELKGRAEELAELAHQLAPEHGLTSYGRPEEGLTPWEIYDEEGASSALEKAERTHRLLREILKYMGVE